MPPLIRPLRRTALLVAGVYLAVAAAWVAATNAAVTSLTARVPDARLELHNYKEAFFVVVTATGLYFALAWLLERQRRLEQEKRRMEEMLQVSQRLEALGSLSAVVVHDFNNVLAIIRGTTALAEAQKLNPDKVAARLGEIEAATVRAAGIVRDLAMFMQDASPEREAVDLAELVRAFEPMARRVLGKGVAWQLDAGAESPPVVVTRSQVDQVLLNLVVNARDALAARKGRRVRVAVKARELRRYVSVFQREPVSGRFVVVTVRDNGCGIAEEDRVRIFDAFYTSKPKGQGTGLGLASAFRVMQQHGGWIEVESQPGRGTVFALFFPAGG